MIKRFINYVALLVLLAVGYSTTQATPLVKLRIGERTVVGNTYYADVMADVAPGETWKLGGVFVFSYNPAALNPSVFNFMDAPEEEIASKLIYNLYPAVLARVGDAPDYISGDYPRAAQFGMDNIDTMFFWNLNYMGNTNGDEPVQGTIRIGTLRFTIVDPLALDNIRILDHHENIETAIMPMVSNGNIDVENVNYLTYGCDDLTCYQIVNPTPRQIIPPTASITTGTVVGPFCPGLTTNVTFTTPVAFNEGNVFTAQLSDASGSFENAVAIGTVTGTESGTIECTIPALASVGTNYRIRVIGTDPVNNGTDNGTDIVINALPSVSEIMSPNPAYCPNSDGSAIIASGLAGVSYQLLKNGEAFGDVVTVDQDGDDMLWAELYAGTYTVVATNASNCSVTMTGEVVITESALPTVLALTPATASYCSDVNGVTLTLAGSEEGVSYQLKKDGDNVGIAQVGTGNDLVWENMLVGNYTVEAAFGAECTLAFEGLATVTENTLPSVYVLAPSANAYCADANGVTLTLAGSEAGVSYQLKNGEENVAEATVGTGAAIEWLNVLAGTYSVVATNATTMCAKTITENPVVITATPLPTATINGNVTVAKSAVTTYTTAETENAIYAWTVIGGTINGANDAASVEITWGNEAGNGSVALVKTVNGCSVETSLNVAVTNFIVPMLQAKYLIFSAVGQDQMIVRWTRGNGNKVLVVAYPGTAVNGTPTMTTEYSLGDAIGEGHVVYNGTGKQVTVTGLTPGETYTFKAYEYFSDANNTGIYTLVDAVYNPRSKSTIPAVPTLNDVANVTSSTADFSWSYNGALSYFEVELATDNAFENIVNGWQGADVGDLTELTIGELEGTTQYFFRVRAVNGYYTSAWATTEFTTIDAEPTELPTDITFANVTDNAMNVSWTGVEGQNYIVVASKEATTVAAPVDGIVYDINDVYGDGFVAYNGDLFTFDATNLDPATMYYFNVFTYNGMLYPNYNPEGATANKTTLATAPEVAPTDMVFSNINETSMNVAWTASTDASRYIVLGVNEADADKTFGTLENATEYTTADLVGDAKVLYVGTATTFDATELLANNTYTFQVYALNGAEVTTNYLNTPLVGTQVTMPLAPETAPSDFLFTNVTPETATVSFTAGSGAKTVVFMNTVDEFTAPVNGTDYVVGEDNVVYVGDASTFNLTDLTAATEYFFAAYSYNGDAELANYNATAANGSFTTLAIAPVVAPTAMVFSNFIETSMNVAWTASTDASRYIVLGVNEADADKTFGTLENATEYTTADLVGDAKVMYVGTATNFNATELLANNTYTFQVYALNGAEATTNYLNTPLVGTQVTMPAAPATAPTALAFANITPTTATVNFTAGSGAKTVVFMNTANVFTAPVNGTEYVAGEGNVVYVGDASTFDLTDLTAGTEYFFAAYSYNDNHGANVNDAELANYNATAANGSFTTLATEPNSPSNLVVSNTTINSMHLSWTNSNNSIVMMNTTGVFTAPVDAHTYTVGGNILYVGANTTFNVTGLDANTTYYFAVYSFEGAAGIENYNTSAATANDLTLPTEPVVIPTVLTTSNITNISMDLAWVNPANSIVMMNTTGTFTAPVDGQAYTAGSNDVIYVGAANTCTATALTPNTRYYFAVYAFNGTAAKVNYNTTPATKNSMTSQYATVTKIAITSTVNNFVNGTPFSVTVQTQDASNQATSSEVARTVTLSQVGNNGTLYGNLTATIPAGSNTVTFSNITFYTNSGVSAFTLKVATGTFEATTNISVPVAAPTTQDKLILFTAVMQNSMTVSWTKGNGTNRILVMKQNVAPTSTPIANQVYAVNDEFGTADGTVVYVGGAADPAQVNLTGLVHGTTYYFKAFNYNNPASPVYCSASGSFNPRSRATVNKDEVAPQDELTEADINNNTFFVSNINPNPVVNTINFKMTNHEEMTMSVSVFDASGREVAKLVDGQLQTKGTQNFSFNLDNNLASGSYLLVVTAGSQTAVQTFSVVK